jgi:hypothetical protein
MQQDGAGDRRKSETDQAGNGCAGEDAGADEE